jgi:adenine-specific DNA-methyltransferase
MTRKQKLELTWIGKNEALRIEPRILVEDADLSFHSVNKGMGHIFDNMLVEGDNLLALKAIESTHAARVKCIYIDPPFNTQQAFENYDDGLEHSVWLNMIRARLVLLHRLLREDGSLFIHIDDNELGYLIAVTDEIFGRRNRISVITFKQSSVSGPKAINPGLVTTCNFILYYVKNKQVWHPNRVFARRPRDDRYSMIIEDISKPPSEWALVRLKDHFLNYLAEKGQDFAKWSPDRFERALEVFVIANADRVVRLARIDAADVSADTREVLSKSQITADIVHKATRIGKSDVFFLNGEQLIFYGSKVREINGEITTAEPLSNLWDDLLSNNVHKEGGVRFPNGKKPESLIKRILELETEPGDLVLDSFAGSGTVAATAHKMGRRWIAVELGEHSRSHILPRMRKVVSGDDNDGISKSVSWKGGGGFKFMRLAKSLLERDRWGNWIVCKEYNAAMLAEAMCKHMGFTYSPSQNPLEYWNHGFSSEQDFIYVTTQSLTHSMFKALSHDVGPGCHLLICCKAFSGKTNEFGNLSVRRIPQAVLATCEWGRDDYSLQIANLPKVETNGDDDPAYAQAPTSKRGRRKIASNIAPDLFGQPAETEA